MNERFPLNDPSHWTPFERITPAIMPGMARETCLDFLRTFTREFFLKGIGLKNLNDQRKTKKKKNKVIFKPLSPSPLLTGKSFLSNSQSQCH